MLRSGISKTIGSWFSLLLVVVLLAAAGASATLPLTNSKAASQQIQKYKKNTLELKLKADSGITLVNDNFTGGTADQTAQLNQLLADAGKLKIAKLHSGETRTSLQQALSQNLNGYYKVVLKNDVNITSLVSSLKALSVVEAAYAEPTPAPSPTSPSFVSSENYLQAAPAGINSNYAKTIGGGNASRVKIVDIEYSWNFSHEDLTKARAALVANGTPVDPYNDNNHGTAAVGEMIADDNSFGVSGASAGASLFLVNADNAERGYDLVNAINVAAGKVTAGDVVIIEQQTWGPTPDTYDYVPVEWVSAVYDSIKTLTARGVNVIEPAGNGAQNLDDSTYYGSTFPMGKADSGAIIVGAGDNCTSSTTRLSRLSFSDYGNRVNLQGPGNCVASTGWYGDLYSAGGVNAYYTGSFNGTSSASPVVAAATADLSSAYLNKYGVNLSPLQIRSYLINNATAQNTASGTISGHIGPYPDLSRAFAAAGLATTADTTPPSAPQNLKITLTSSNRPKLTWTAATDNVGVTAYKIYRNGVYYATVTNLSFTDSSVKHRTTYQYKVAAVDAAGNLSAFSSTVSITTK